MKKELKIIAIFLLLYVINKNLKNYITIPIIGWLCKNYLNDFYCGIVFCAYVNIVLSKSKYRILSKCYQFIVVNLIAGIVWEYIAPIFISYSVSDKYDILAYILGAIVYYFICRKGKLNWREIIIQHKKI